MSHELLELAPAVREKWPFLARHARVNGWRMHYVDEGKGDPVLLLHGNPTWGFLYRDVIGPLVQSGRRVVVLAIPGFARWRVPRCARAHRSLGPTVRIRLPPAVSQQRTASGDR